MLKAAAPARPDGYVRVVRMLTTYARAARASRELGALGVGRAEGFEGAIEAIRREVGGDS
jgi:hypothetical protein